MSELYKQSTTKAISHRVPSEHIKRTRCAVVLAAGSGTRIQNSSKAIQPKPLIELGGLYLAERAILNLKSAGIERFHVVVGAYRDQVVPALKACKSLQGLDIHFIECPDFEKGNGVSLCAGVQSLNESFLLVMSDHVMSPLMIRHFLSEAQKNPERAYLATDPDVPNVFDLDDATKVFTREGRIESISKSLSRYNEIDTGLFYFPATAPKLIREAVAGGKYSVSEIVAQIQNDDGFYTLHVAPGTFWQDVDTPAMAREAEKRLLKSLVKQNDSYLVRTMNRPFSLYLSRYLSKWGIEPVLISTSALLISVTASLIALQGSTAAILLSLLVFHLASILDGCDGEVARMTLKQSPSGARYDTLVHYLRFGIYGAALSIALWGLSAPAVFVAVTTLALACRAAFKSLRTSQGFAALRWAMGNESSFVFFLGGAALFTYLYTSVPLGNVLGSSRAHVGEGLLWLFAVAPLWFAANALGLSSLVQHKIGFWGLFQNQVVSESVNTVAPLAGLQGEPFKARHLARWLDFSEAKKVTLQERLVHICAGLYFAALMLILSFVVISLPALLVPWVLALAFVFVASALFFTSLLVHPPFFEKVGNHLVRLRVIQGFVPLHFDRGTWQRALTSKFVGRLINLLEIYMIFKILGMHPGLSEVVALGAALSTSAVLFFIIPQGLGVYELAICGAFALLHLPLDMALAFGLLRRTRVWVYAFCGLSLVISQGFAQKIKSPLNRIS